MVEPGHQKRTNAAAAKRVTCILWLVLITAFAQSTPASAQIDEGTTPAFQSTPAAASRPFEENQDFKLGAAVGQAFGFTVFQQVARLRETKTRQELGGPFLRDWLTSVWHTGRNWDDGGKIFTNYMAHPMGGGVYANIYRQNDERRRKLKIGEPGYGGMFARAMLFSAIVSAQFEIGPVSEASIGNVGMRNASKMGWVDFVVTPTLGTAWMVGEDVIDERILKAMDGTNIVLRSTVRLFLNPSRSGANLSRGKWPWFRDRDAG